MPTCTKDGCGGQIAWAKTVPGMRPMPVNIGSSGDPGGNLAVWKDGKQLLCRVLRKGEEPAPGQFRGVAHWVTCAKSAEARRTEGWRSEPRKRRWAYYYEDGELGAWFHHERIKQADFADLLAQLRDQHPDIPPLPDEARPPAVIQGELL